jgi:prevent-host-death family protein
MREQVISVTEAARNFADCVNRARYQGMSFVLHKNGVPVARIVPVEKADKTGEPTAAGSEVEEHRELHLSEEEAAALLRQLEKARKAQLPSRYATRRALNW